MKTQLSLALLGAMCMAGAAMAATPDYDALYATFKAKYSKQYGAEEHDNKKAVFKANWDKVLELNAEHVAAGGEEVFGMSPFLDVTPEEFKRTHLPGFEMEWVPKGKPALRGADAEVDAPSSFDWRSKGGVTAVKDQGQCGSCWAFSATECIESANAIAGRGLKDLAPQQIVDCDSKDNACGGGLPSQAYQYVISAGGLEGESDYPYTSGTTKSAGQCNFNKGDVVETISGWQSVGQDEGSMQSALVAHGPLSIVVDASTWQYYTGGVLSNCGTQLDHAVQAVGYSVTSEATGARALQTTTTTPTTPTTTTHHTTPTTTKPTTTTHQKGGGYWLVRNSWNTSWGESGYIRLAYGKNTCGLTQVVTYATV